MFSFLRKITPQPLLQVYHWLLAHIAALLYGYPSEQLLVIGVTGTNGKSSTVSIIAKILEAGGFKVGSTSTIEFKVAEKKWINDKKMTMVGRFELQKLLRQMVQSGCTHAIIETTSQGIEQFRHLGLNYDIAVFTNLTPEHIEAHGGFENYKKAKGKLFQHLAKSVQKKRDAIFHDNSNELIQKRAVVNMDDPLAKYFLSLGSYEQWGYGLIDSRETTVKSGTIHKIFGSYAQKGVLKNILTLDGIEINLKLLGQHNAYNALAAVVVAQTQGIGIELIKHGLESVDSIPGRLEFIENNRQLTIIVDYAHEPESLKKIYKVIQHIPHQRIIHILGSAGGGRDIARRPILGTIAAHNADIVIVTNEDPYDDDINEIIDQVADGALKSGKVLNHNLHKILDRREAIATALQLAQAKDLILVTGKGCEQAIVTKNRRTIPWDDRKVIRQELMKNL